MGENKLVVVIMGQNCERFIEMALESVKDADTVIYCDGGSTDKTIEIVGEFLKPSGEVRKAAIIRNEYDQSDRGMNGKQRNFYLDYIKQNYPEWWCLAIDADEVVEDLNKIREFIKIAFPAVYSVKMRHFIGDLGHEDSTEVEHWVPNRLFKVSHADFYPEIEHPVLQPRYYLEDPIQKKEPNVICIKKPNEKLYTFIGTTDCTTIWHLAYIPNMWEIKRRYENHVKKSDMHTPQFLKEWYFLHLFGGYPRKDIKFIEIPGIILREFGIDPDEIYFMTHKTLEIKHFIMMSQWLDFTREKIGAANQEYQIRILDMGCGWGMYGYAAGMMNIDWHGIEKSRFACENSIMKDRMQQGDILEISYYGESKEYDLVLLIDILEHLEKKDLDQALENIKDAGTVFIISLPFLGDPNLFADPTHKIFESKQWWMEKLGQHFKISEAPENWMVHNQILIGERK